MEKTSKHDADLDLATKLAIAAGQAILDVRVDAIAHASQKSDLSPVTKADLAADRIIREGLSRAGDVVVTEETWGGGALAEHRRVWFVDPLDGTAEFIAGRADYVVQIGLCVDGSPVLGVLFQPETGIMWRGVVDEAIPGGGLCERIDPDGSRHALRVDARVLAVPRVAVSFSHPSSMVSFIADELGGVTVPKGSVGLKVGLIVNDEADAYLTSSQRIKVWDTCAPAAVLLAAGGVVTALDGSPLVFHGSSASHPAGVSMWTPAAEASLRGTIDDAMKRFRSAQRR